MQNLVKMSDLTNEAIYSLIKRASEFKAGSPVQQRNDLFIANLFFENSTRTKHSFEVAEKLMQLNIINFEVQTSSVNKGETLYDTCKTLEMLGCHALVIRHSQEAYYEELTNLNIPIVSGGDGSGEHPSQCLLDLMTIYERFGRIEGLNIVIAGDIKNSRVARSNYLTLTRLGASVQFVGPSEFEDATLGKMVDFDEAIDKIDVCMLLRVQHERHADSPFSVENYHQHYGLTKERYRRLAEHAIVMHPAPINRGVEIDTDLVEAEQSVIFEQMRNGVFMRQAILEKIIQDNQL
ncbi:MAG: aspartate carbamoyltransferase catalytic subunit [Aerococcaceae bacterium]|nr:aspartate carbamoyltransferase catalytic subunit [Aerococcaceae bacterium]